MIKETEITREPVQMPLFNKNALGHSKTFGSQRTVRAIYEMAELINDTKEVAIKQMLVNNPSFERGSKYVRQLALSFDILENNVYGLLDGYDYSYEMWDSEGRSLMFATAWFKSLEPEQHELLYKFYTIDVADYVRYDGRKILRFR